MYIYLRVQYVKFENDTDKVSKLASLFDTTKLEEIIPLQSGVFAFISRMELVPTDYDPAAVHVFQSNTDERFYRFVSFVAAFASCGYRMFGDPHYNLCLLFTLDSLSLKLTAIKPLLSGVVKLATPRFQPGMFAIGNPLDGMESRIEELGDRADALSIIGDAYNCGSYAARMVVYSRLFEAAFDKRFAGVAKPLYRFLQTGKLKVSRSDVDDWLNIRHSGAHGRKAFKKFAPYEIFKFLDIVHYAACDVLLNKINWGKADLGRRDFSDISEGETGQIESGFRLQCVDPTHSIVLNEAAEKRGRNLVFSIESWFSRTYPTLSKLDTYRLDRGSIMLLSEAGLEVQPTGSDLINFSNQGFFLRSPDESWLKGTVSSGGTVIQFGEATYPV